MVSDFKFRLIPCFQHRQFDIYAVEGCTVPESFRGSLERRRLRLIGSAATAAVPLYLPHQYVTQNHIKSEMGHCWLDFNLDICLFRIMLCPDDWAQI
jgi:hypothetical protein